jgi:hypothetical protein
MLLSNSVKHNSVKEHHLKEGILILSHLKFNCACSHTKVNAAQPEATDSRIQHLSVLTRHDNDDVLDLRQTTPWELPSTPGLSRTAQLATPFPILRSLGRQNPCHTSALQRHQHAFFLTSTCVRRYHPRPLPVQPRYGPANAAPSACLRSPLLLAPATCALAAAS